MHEPSETSDSDSKLRAADHAVPDDFPRDPFPEIFSGSQEKYGARRINGRFVVGVTPEERAERYLGCLELVDQLTAYVHRKLTQKPEVTLTAVLENVISRIPHQGWTLGWPELAWIKKQLRARFASSSAND